MQFILPDPNDPGSSIEVKGLFDDGTVIGYIAGGDVLPDRGFAWKDGKFLPMGKELTGAKSRLQGASANGLAAGWLGPTGAAGWAPRRWSSATRSLAVIPIPDPFVWGEGRAVSSQGWVAGRCQLPDPKTGLANSTYQAFIWDGVTTQVITPLPGDNSAFFSGINDVGQAVGTSYCAGGGKVCEREQQYNTNAVLWQDDTLINLDPIIKQDPRWKGSVFYFASDINNAGQIVLNGVAAPQFGSLILLTPHPPAGDVNIDCKVNVRDLVMLIDNWGPVTANSVRRADLDGNGVVDGFDLAEVLGGWTAP